MFFTCWFGLNVAINIRGHVAMKVAGKSCTLSIDSDPTLGCHAADRAWPDTPSWYTTKGPAWRSAI